MQAPPKNATDEELGRWLRLAAQELRTAPASLVTLAKEAMDYNRHTAGDDFTRPEVLETHEFTGEEVKALPAWAKAMIQPGGDIALCQWPDGQRWVRLRTARARVLGGVEVTDQTPPAPRLRILPPEGTPFVYGQPRDSWSIDQTHAVVAAFNGQPRPALEEAALETRLVRIAREHGQPLRLLSISRESPTQWHRPGSFSYPGSAPGDVAIYVCVQWLLEPSRLGGSHYLAYNQNTGLLFQFPGLVGE